MSYPVVSFTRLLTSSAIRNHGSWLVALVVLAAAISCSEDLPVQPAAGDATGMDEQSQMGNSGGAGGSAGKPSMTATGSGGGVGGSNTAGKGGSGATSGTNGGSSEAGGEGGTGSSSMSSDGKSGAGGSSGSSGAASPPKPTVKVVPACMGRAGELICDGAKMIKCGDLFEAAETQPCQTEAQCRAGLEGGKCGACDPGVAKCMEDGLYVCNMQGAMDLTPCDSPALCDEIGKKCDPPACKMDEHKCEGGELLRCLDDLTDFESKMACPMELCDATGKKCNVCLPDSKMCVGDVLEVCSADGSGKQEMKCTGDKPMCVGDKCVQCMGNEDCKAPNDCQTTTCNNGTCTPPQNKRVGTACSGTNGGKVCSLLGECVACNTDLDCDSNSQRCSAVFGCIERAALTVIPSFLPGTYTVQVNAGYGVKISQVKSSEADLRVTWTGGGQSGVTAMQGATVLEKLNTTRTVTFRGPGGQGMLGDFPVNCTGSATFDGTGATLQFARVGTEMMPGNCMDQVIGLTATQ